LGLADGLAAVHGINDDPHAHMPAQIHADIKPENILCFTSGNGERGPFTLKLADFGEAQEVRTDTRDVESRHVAHTKTYRPPEHDTDDLLTLNYDIWCLGCVYLELITWAVEGSESLDSFENVRFDERDDRNATTAKGEVLADTFFRKVAKHGVRMFFSDITFGYKTTSLNHGNGSRKAARMRHSWWFEHKASHAKAEIKSGVKSVSSFPYVFSLLSFPNASFLLLPECTLTQKIAYQTATRAL
jgi:serine/threonine protein kinase